MNANGRPRYVPIIRNITLRTAMGLIAALISSIYVARTNESALWVLIIPLFLGWILSINLTDKYKHKYPHRYYSYLLASHGKAAIVMGLVLGIIAFIASGGWFSERVFLAAAIFSASDLLISLPRRRAPEPLDEDESFGADRHLSSVPDELPMIVNKAALLNNLAKDPMLGRLTELATLVDESIPQSCGEADKVDIIEADLVESAAKDRSVALLIQLKSLNAVRRLNLFLKGLADTVVMGGYFVCRYRSLDDELVALRLRKRGLRFILSYAWHFLRFRALPKVAILERLYFSKPLEWLDGYLYKRSGERRRVISRAEVWGRLYFWGFEVLGERVLDSNCWLICRRFREPEKKQMPSFFLIAHLNKVGLEGKSMHLRKIRTMYPFSEFIQERLFRDHGLSNTGKFKNDFRLTEFGRFLRRYWLDEIPQVLDWLRGEIKLVGMRATSPHFLSLYPRELYDLYIQTKPGLVPPIFDAATTGFDDIVRIELEYLKAYQKTPIKTDTKYFFRTVRDIFFRGVRSR